MRTDQFVQTGTTEQVTAITPRMVKRPDAPNRSAQTALEGNSLSRNTLQFSKLPRMAGSIREHEQRLEPVRKGVRVPLT